MTKQRKNFSIFLIVKEATLIKLSEKWKNEEQGNYYRCKSFDEHK